MFGGGEFLNLYKFKFHLSIINEIRKVNFDRCDPRVRHFMLRRVTEKMR